MVRLPIAPRQSYTLGMENDYSPDGTCVEELGQLVEQQLREVAQRNSMSVDLLIAQVFVRANQEDEKGATP